MFGLWFSSNTANFLETLQQISIGKFKETFNSSSWLDKLYFYVHLLDNVE